MTSSAPRTSGILPTRHSARQCLAIEEILDDLRVLVPNCYVAIVLEPSYRKSRRVIVDPGVQTDTLRRAALKDSLAAWIVEHANRLRAPGVPVSLRGVLPADRVVIVPIRWGNWLAGAFAIDAQWLEEGHIAALQEMASNLAVKIATDDWAARNEESSGVIFRLPTAVAV